MSIGCLEVVSLYLHLHDQLAFLSLRPKRNRYTVKSATFLRAKNISNKIIVVWLIFIDASS